MRETWEYLEEFPDHCISNFGEVYNARTKQLKSVWLNAQGIPSVSIYKEGSTKGITRSVPLLVARYFVERPDSTFNTPIHLNGYKTDSRADNLMWRPRPFALAYSRQFDYQFFHSSRTVLRDLDSGEIFEGVKAPAVRYGLIGNHLLIAAHNREPVWPTRQMFECLD